MEKEKLYFLDKITNYTYITYKKKAINTKKVKNKIHKGKGHLKLIFLARFKSVKKFLLCR